MLHPLINCSGVRRLDSSAEQAEVTKFPSRVENSQLKDHPGYGQLLTAYHPKDDNQEALKTFFAPPLAEQSDEMRNHVRSRGRDRDQRSFGQNVKGP